MATGFRSGTAGAPATKKEQDRTEAADESARNVGYDEFDDDLSDCVDELLAAVQSPIKNKASPRKPAVIEHEAPSIGVDNKRSPTNTGDESDDFGDIDLEDIDFDDFDDIDEPQKAAHPVDPILSRLGSLGHGNVQSHQGTQAIQRYLILDVAESTYVTERGQKRPEKVLFVREERCQVNRAVMLRETWFDSPCSKDSFIHIIGDFDPSGQCVVDNSKNMVIVHPDHLISATVVADSFSCIRRAVLQDRVKATSEANAPQVYGHILHEIFQKAMAENRWDMAWLKKTINHVLERYLEGLYEIKIEVDEAVAYLTSKMPLLREWANVFMKYAPSADSFMEDRNGTRSSVSINKLLDVEEHIWSPMYGLKGNVDATVQVSMKEGLASNVLTVPLELKTGKNNAIESHRAQAALYSLLLSDRYDIDVTFGILYYLESMKTFRIRAIRTELVQMIQQRNHLAEFIRHKLELPQMLRRSRTCNSCFAKSACFIYHKLVDNGNGETSGVGNSFLELTDHLSPAHQEFFVKWDTLLTMEEKEMMKFKRELWTMLSTEREAVGRCFSNVIIKHDSIHEDTDGPKINRFRYTFTKHQHPRGFSFMDSQLTVGEPIVISDENGHFALANGYVMHISSKSITVSVDRRLHNARSRNSGFHETKNQAFTGIMEITSKNGRQITEKPQNTEETKTYRIDKDEFSNGMATVRNNLVSIMEKNRLGGRLRKLIIDNKPPVFNPISSSEIPSATESNLNIDQKQAIEKVLSADDYALVLGMPGTGKTTTIAQIIRTLVMKGKSVLLTSYTHTAVDNILLKIRNDNIRVLRLGAPTKIHPDIQTFAELATTPRKTIAELRDVYENSQIVATTCLGVNHSVFNNRTFDYCIVDEASQITLPVCLGPIRMANTFILVGDHYQLPPLVQNKEAQEGGLDVSLFKLLCDRQPSSVASLEHQYRMCEDIMLLSNNLIYSGHLKCGTRDVATSFLKVPNFQGLKRHHVDLASQSTTMTRDTCLGSRYGRCWLRDLIDPVAKARFVNTDHLQPEAVDSAKGSRIVNPIEAMICAQLVEALISVGVAPQEIGIVTLYRSQLALLKQRLHGRFADVEMHTADRFQGRDKEIIIMSCVRSNEERNVGELLRDWRRVNVAFSRARTKLLVVGSKETLREGNRLLGKFVQLMNERGWIYDLPASAVDSHLFEELEASIKSPRTKVPSPVKRSPVKPLIFDDQSPRRRSPLLPKSSKLQAQPPRPMSPVKRRKIEPELKQPQKKGAKPLDGSKIISKKDVIRDIYNDIVG